MSVETFDIKYRFPLSSQELIFRVTATDRQIADLMKNERSFLWPHLNRKAIAAIGLELDSLPGIFGKINLKGLHEGVFVRSFREIDLTDVPF